MSINIHVRSMQLQDQNSINFQYTKEYSNYPFGMDVRQEIESELNYSMTNFNLIIDLLRESETSLLQTKVGDSEWTIIEVLRHVQNAEKGIVNQIKQILDGGKGFPADFDLHRYNEGRRKKMEHISMDQVVEKMEENRKYTLEVLGALRDGELDKRGIFANQKEYSIKTFFKTIFNHQNNHIEKIREILNR